MTRLKWNRFLAHSCWIVPLYFYGWIPLLLEKIPAVTGLILLFAVLPFLWVWMAKRQAYREKNHGRIRFMVDLSVMVLGLVLLYGMECSGFNVVGSGSPDWRYICCIMTNAPAVWSVKQMEWKERKPV